MPVSIWQYTGICYFLFAHIKYQVPPYHTYIQGERERETDTEKEGGGKREIVGDYCMHCVIITQKLQETVRGRERERERERERKTDTCTNNYAAALVL